MQQRRADILSSLQSDILRLQGFKSPGNTTARLNLGLMDTAFPNGVFPLGAIHEFLPADEEDTASTSGFVASLLSNVIGSRGIALWISTSRTLFPPALKTFGISPEKFIFIDLKKEKDVWWAVEEGLKCTSVAAVVGEMPTLDFTSSRRLQLAVEQSCVTGFVIRPFSQKLTTTACVSRWKIASLPGEVVDDLPGVGYPQWRVELQRVRNGKPGAWDVKWMEGQLKTVAEKALHHFEPEERKAG
ncbi:Error-prone repair protein ImuA [uncultured Imperialibacter sp.]|uniref:ImuA family protein n=1 Tax=uncultured Imperialibacter sp. TaxID=1672639 RepID=UPI0030D87B01|tara:strand:- start:678 stop:1409 length:732 start_codon:yes stop_codon:yes gene_type:complete